MGLGQCLYGQVAATVTAAMTVTYISHIDSANADDLGSFTNRRDLFSTGLGLFDIAPKNTGVCAQVDERLGLYLADGTCASGHEDDPVVCKE